MSEPPRLRRVEEIYHGALARGGAERNEYLQSACGGDAGLLQEVQSLLGYEAEAREFLGEPAARAATQKLALSRGTRLGPYEVAELIGAGGMGEVYRARDTRLDRAVAIKVLPDHVAQDADALARFSREARSIAALSHPHICALHDVGREGDVHYLVMELLEGETLAQRLKRGPLKLDLLLRHAIEIAEALAAAHSRGVVHRDLKPGNVMLTRAGAKLLDFGLAKLRRSDGPDAASIDRTASREEVLAGTPPYMAPEQLERGTADARTDVFALGALVFEMATGERAFAADSPAQLIASIVQGETPSLVSRRPGTPAALDRLVGVCLRKDPSERWQSAHDIALRLREIAQDASSGGSRRSSVAARWALPVLAATAAVALAVPAFVARSSRAGPPPAVVRSHIDLAADVALPSHPSRTAIALSPDGTQLVWTGRPNNTTDPALWALHARRLDNGEVRRLAGTEGATAPFFSPDGRWLAFFTGPFTRLRKVPVEGGLPVDIADVPERGVGYGACWMPDGRILVAASQGLSAVSSDGGALREVTRVDRTREARHVTPSALPGGRTILFTVMPHPWGVKARVEALSLDDGTRKLVVDDAADARYLPTGHLLFLRRGVLMAAPFDASRLELGAPAVPVVSAVSQALDMAGSFTNSGAGQFAVSASGLLVYAAGGIFEYPPVELVLIDAEGRSEPLPGFDRPAVSPQGRLSPDGRHLAFVEQARSGLLWLFDVERQTYRRLSDDGVAGCPVWSPDGTRLVVSLSRGGPLQLWEVPLQEGGEWRRLAESEYSDCGSDWSSDGRFLAFTRFGDTSGSDILLYDFDRLAVAPFLETDIPRGGPAFSPDGRWLVYSSNESGRIEVYVTSFPDRKRTDAVSRLGGLAPFWSRDGRSLFYAARPSAGGASLMSVSVHTDPALSLASPRLMARLPQEFLCPQPMRCIDQVADGRFLVGKWARPLPAEPITRLHLVQNWFTELDRLSPRPR